MGCIVHFKCNYHFSEIEDLDTKTWKITFYQDRDVWRELNKNYKIDKCQTHPLKADKEYQSPNPDSWWCVV